MIFAFFFVHWIADQALLATRRLSSPILQNCY